MSPDDDDQEVSPLVRRSPPSSETNQHQRYHSGLTSRAVHRAAEDSPLDDWYDKQKKTTRSPNSHEGVPPSTQCCESMKHDVIDLAHKVPGSARVMRVVNRLPRWVRIGFLVMWLIWKVVMTIMFVKIMLHTAHLSHKKLTTTGLLGSTAESKLVNAFEGANNPSRPFKILNIVTALAEYNNGARGTMQGDDRLVNMLLPLLSESVNSMLEHKSHWQVDVYLILGWNLEPARRKLIEEALPKGVKLEIWDDAIPLGYDNPKHSKISPITRTLARQHRFVIYDNLHKYDFFNVWEDDMHITAQHVQYFMDMSYELERLRLAAVKRESSMEPTTVQRDEKFYGDLSSVQLYHMIPGFFRVEVLPTVEDAKANTQSKPKPIPTDFEFEVSINKGVRPSNKIKIHHVDPIPCCHVPIPKKSAQQQINQDSILLKLPHHPEPAQLMTWETNIEGFSLRQFPSDSLLDWVALQLGPKDLSDAAYTHSFWVGEPGYLGPNSKRESGANPQLFGQQGGFMLHRAHILRLVQVLCPGRFLPPFEMPYFKQNGLWMNNVEFYSGGYQIFSNNGMQAGCNLQRVVDLNPTKFSHHLIYHTSNNKQRTIDQDRRVQVDVLFGQLNTVRKAAIAKKQQLSTI